MYVSSWWRKISTTVQNYFDGGSVTGVTQRIGHVATDLFEISDEQETTKFDDETSLQREWQKLDDTVCERLQKDFEISNVAFVEFIQQMIINNNRMDVIEDETTPLKKRLKTIAELVLKEDLTIFCENIQYLPLEKQDFVDFADRVLQTNILLFCEYIENFCVFFPELQKQLQDKVRNQNIGVFCQYLLKFGYKEEKERLTLAIELAHSNPGIVCSFFLYFILKKEEDIEKLMEILQENSLNNLIMHFYQFASCLSDEKKICWLERLKEKNPALVCSCIEKFRLPKDYDLFSLACFLIKEVPAIFLQNIALFSLQKEEYQKLFAELKENRVDLLLEALCVFPFQNKNFFYQEMRELANTHPEFFRCINIVNKNTILLSMEQKEEMIKIVSSHLLKANMEFNEEHLNNFFMGALVLPNEEIEADFHQL